MRTNERGWRRAMGALAVAGACSLALLAGGCATSVIAPSSDDGDAERVEIEAESVDGSQLASLETTETGWWAKDSYVHYGVTVRNPNSSAFAEDVPVKVVLYDEDGAIIDESEETIALVGPGETTTFAGTAGNGWAPARVEIEVEGDSAVWRNAEGYRAPFTIESYEEENKLYYRYEVTGRILNQTDDYVSTVRLSIIMRDEEGRIVAGYPGEAYRIKSGQTKDFLVTMNTAPDHASVEVFAQPVD